MALFPKGMRTGEYGIPGSEVSGSKYYRGYCMMCGDPIRVVYYANAKEGVCACNDCVNVDMLLERKLGVGNNMPSVPISESEYDGGV